MAKRSNNRASKSEPVASRVNQTTEQPVLYRSETDRVLAGVAGGLGRYLNVNSNAIRIVFILISFYAGLGVLLYVLLWILIPTRSALKKNPKLAIAENLQEVKLKAEKVTGKESRALWGFLILIIGSIFLLDSLNIVSFSDIFRYWPLIVIFVGLSILIRR